MAAFGNQAAGTEEEGKDFARSLAIQAASSSHAMHRVYLDDGTYKSVKVPVGVTADGFVEAARRKFLKSDLKEENLHVSLFVQRGTDDIPVCGSAPVKLLASDKLKIKLQQLNPLLSAKPGASFPGRNLLVAHESMTTGCESAGNNDEQPAETCQPMLTAPSRRSGYLMKQSPAGLHKMRPWQRRWFVMEELAFAYYDDEDEEELLGAVPYASIQSMNQIEKSDKSVLVIETKDRRTDGATKTYTLAGESATDVSNWLLALNAWRDWIMEVAPDGALEASALQGRSQKSVQNGSSRGFAFIKALVSKNKLRLVEDGFNLDMTYITDQIIAMGFPSSNVEGLYRNHFMDVRQFLDRRHSSKYKVYNLCSERSYSKSRFYGRVEFFPFDDHNPPPLEMIKPFCKNVHSWLKPGRNTEGGTPLDAHSQETRDSGSSRPVVAIHCKAGKGRTGVMIVCYLLFIEQFKDATSALHFYGHARTNDGHGVTIPSQKRYCDYFSQILQGKVLERNPVRVAKVVVRGSPIGHTWDPRVTIINGHTYITGEESTALKSDCFEIPLDAVVSGDVKFILASEGGTKKGKLMHFWLHSDFMLDQTGESIELLDGHGQESHKSYSIIVLTKQDIDKAVKDKDKNKKYPSDFKIEVHVVAVPRDFQRDSHDLFKRSLEATESALSSHASKKLEFKPPVCESGFTEYNFEDGDCETDGTSFHQESDHEGDASFPQSQETTVCKEETGTQVHNSISVGRISSQNDKMPPSDSRRLIINDLPTIARATVLFNFRPSRGQVGTHLPLLVGQSIEILRMDNSGWWLGRSQKVMPERESRLHVYDEFHKNSAVQTGWFPERYVSITSTLSTVEEGNGNVLMQASPQESNPECSCLPRERSIA